LFEKYGLRSVRQTSSVCRHELRTLLPETSLIKPCLAKFACFRYKKKPSIKAATRLGEEVLSKGVSLIQIIMFVKTTLKKITLKKILQIHTKGVILKKEYKISRVLLKCYYGESIEILHSLNNYRIVICTL
jgi:hypothetical protein